LRQAGLVSARCELGGNHGHPLGHAVELTTCFCFPNQGLNMQWVLNYDPLRVFLFSTERRHLSFKIPLQALTVCVLEMLAA
jgi:hypothetical protein